MRKLKMPKKMKVKLSEVMVGIFLAVLLCELFVLYQYIFVNIKYKALVSIPDKPQAAKIDLSAYGQVQTWLSEKQKYKLPQYSLVKPDSGRENPFAEYR